MGTVKQEYQDVPSTFLIPAVSLPSGNKVLATTSYLPSVSNTGPMVSFSLPLIQEPVAHNHLMIQHSPSPTDNSDDLISDEEARRRRELLARRPSYRKILSDLSGAELDLRHKDSDSGGDSSDDSNTSEGTMTGSHTGMPSSTLSGSVGDSISYAASVIPHGALHFSSSTNGDLNVGGLLPPGTASGLLQYPIQESGPQQILVPMSGNDLLGLKPMMGSSTSLVSQSLINFPSPGNGIPQMAPSKPAMVSQGHSSSSASGSNGGGTGDDSTRKREIRLLKNREAAKECRRKKKEYVKCLENRVTVLEAQNKQLIEELRALKELYCRKAD